MFEYSAILTWAPCIGCTLFSLSTLDPLSPSLRIPPPPAVTFSTPLFPLFLILSILRTVHPPINHPLLPPLSPHDTRHPLPLLRYHLPPHPLLPPHISPHDILFLHHLFFLPSTPLFPTLPLPPPSFPSTSSSVFTFSSSSSFSSCSFTSYSSSSSCSSSFASFSIPDTL